MRSLILSLIFVSSMIGCSNFYPIFLSTPTDEPDVPIDTSIPQDTIDSVGNYLSRDTLLNGAQNLDSSFTLHVSYTMGSDSNLTLFYKLDSLTEMSFTVMQFDKKIAIKTKVVNGVYQLSSSSLAPGLVSIYVEEIDTTTTNVNTMLYLQQSDTAKHINPTYGEFNTAYQFKEIVNRVNQPIDPTLWSYKIIDYVVGDTLIAYLDCDTLLDIVIVDKENFEKIFDSLNDDTITYIYKKEQQIERLKISHTVSCDSLYYLGFSNSDSIITLTDSIVQKR